MRNTTSRYGKHRHGHEYEEGVPVVNQANEVKILLVEDTDAELAIHALRRHGLTEKLLRIKNGAEAIDYLFTQGAHAARDPEQPPPSPYRAEEAAGATAYRLIAGGRPVEGKLRVLILEDVPSDAELMQHTLRRAGIAFEALCVDNREAFERALPEFRPDIVLADYHLPAFTGLEAVQIVRREYPQIPVVIVTGTLGNLTAAETLQTGARDYVLKGDLERLPHAVQHALFVERGIRARKSAEKALREREAFYHTILEDLPALICRWRPDGTITYVNDNYCRYFGKRREELLGHRLVPVIPAEDQPLLAAHRAAINMGKSVATVEYRGRNAAGETHWQRWIDRPLLDAQGNIREFQSSGWDIDERKRLEQLGLESEIAARMAEGVQLTRVRDGIIVYTNPRFEQMFGYAHGELLGKSVAVLNAATEHSPEQTFAEISATLRERGSWEGDVHNRRKDGSEFWCHATASTFDHPEHGPVWLAVHLDISARKEVERLKDELVSTVSHELRTPLTTMLGFVGLLRNREMTREREQELLAIIEQEGQRLTRLLNDFLDIQRLESGRQEYHWQALEITSLLHEALALYAASTTRHTLINAVPAGLPPVTVDPDRLRQVLDNLIFNAIKYSPAGGNITLGARSEADEVVVWVADQGLGIPPEAMSQLFSKFYRVESTATKGIGGTGLGLPLVKEIIEAHQGRVWVESEPGKGSTFSFSLPLARQERKIGAGEDPLHKHGAWGDGLRATSSETDMEKKR
jgi:PAS domain S-box-containing protein